MISQQPHVIANILQMGPWLDTQLRTALEPRFRLLPVWRQADPARYIADHGRSVRAILTFGSAPRTDVAVLQLLPRLELVVNLNAGSDAVDMQELAARGIPIRSGAGANAADVAELAMGLMLAVGRRLLQGDRQVRQETWPDRYTPNACRVGGRRLGIVGMGAIGREVARRAAAFDMPIAYHSRRPADVPWPFVTSLHELARASDVLVVAVPGGPATRHLVDASALDALGTEGILINVARGSVVDETALVEALQEGRIAGAGLDVFEHEPSVPAGLRQSDRVVLTPHRGGLTHEAFAAIVQRAREHLESHFG